MRTDAEIIIGLFTLLQHGQERLVTSAELAELMNLSRASIHRRVEKLIKRELLVKDNHKKLFLTETGLAYANQLQVQHAEIRRFFETACSLPSIEADKCAAALVAELSDETRSQMCMVMAAAM